MSQHFHLQALNPVSLCRLQLSHYGLCLLEQVVGSFPQQTFHCLRTLCHGLAIIRRIFVRTSLARVFISFMSFV